MHCISSVCVLKRFNPVPMYSPVTAIFSASQKINTVNGKHSGAKYTKWQYYKPEAFVPLRFPFVDRIARDELFGRDFRDIGNVTGQEKSCDCKSFAQEWLSTAAASWKINTPAPSKCPQRLSELAKNNAASPISHPICSPPRGLTHVPLPSSTGKPRPQLQSSSSHHGDPRQRCRWEAITFWPQSWRRQPPRYPQGPTYPSSSPTGPPSSPCSNPGVPEQRQVLRRLTQNRVK